jgi:C-terminal processing protease CtpA/Prc
MGTVILYGASITEADIKMTDGQSLERRGVNPDTLILPTASDLANGRDPVLAHAAEMLNVKISPEESGSLFPYVWPKE